MNTYKIIQKLMAACLVLAVWSVSSMVGLAQQQSVAGDLTVLGNVTVNNQSAVSGSTIVSNSTIRTGENSSATVSLGKLGRVEVLANSSLVLKFDDAGIYGTLNEGKVRVMSMAGVTANIATLEGIAVADAAQANTFTVEKECGHTHIDTVAGLVNLRTNAGESKQVAAGTDALAGNLQQPGCKTPCFRQIPGSAPTPTLGLGLGALVGLLLAAGAAVATGVAISNSSGGTNVNNTGGGVIVVSPTR